jgi:hypothetical protein
MDRVGPPPGRDGFRGAMNPVGAQQVPLTIGVSFLSVRPSSIVAGLIYAGTCFTPTTVAPVPSATSVASVASVASAISATSVASAASAASVAAAVARVEHPAHTSTPTEREATYTRVRHAKWEIPVS